MKRDAAGRLLRAFYERMFAAWGTQHWWPGETPFEVMVGAILTQNTAWTNVERAIANLKAAGALDPHALHAAPHERLAEWLRPSGYFNIKARRLKSFIEFYLCEADGRVEGLAAQAAGTLREKLLAVSGIGRETADSILLYALNHPVFVIDAYTRRVLERHGLARGDDDYDELRALFERHLPRDLRLYNEYHALFVRVGKYHCRKREPLCDGCPLAYHPRVTRD